MDDESALEAQEIPMHAPRGISLYDYSELLAYFRNRLQVVGNSKLHLSLMILVMRSMRPETSGPMRDAV